MKKCITLLLAMSLLIAGCAKEETAPNKGVTLLDRNGQTLCTVYEINDLYKDDRWAFFDIAVSQAATRTAALWDTTWEDARQILFADGYQISTTFDPAAFSVLQATFESVDEKTPYGCALTDLQGNLLAVYSTKDDKYTNYASSNRSPYSAFKALSVYTPALEQNKITWSSLYEDSPYKQLENDKGQMQDWPANASGKYSGTAVTVYDGLRASLNTVAVKCLQDVGISKSIEFLQTAFEIPLAEEEYVVKQYGEEEVLGNIALGYLETGVTAVQMAGYYQIFATGGAYIPPTAVLRITDESGASVYVHNKESRQVISAATADTMNYLLRGVVAKGGTGTEAQCAGLEVAGKTGTGDDFADNWFVGVTPSYSCAVWHGQDESNRADSMFAVVMDGLYNGQDTLPVKFITHKNLQQIAYCARSGKAFSDGCTRIELGYYAQADALELCDSCAKK